jgi:hypothetical protein
VPPRAFPIGVFPADGVFPAGRVGAKHSDDSKHSDESAAEDLAGVLFGGGAAEVAGEHAGHFRHALVAVDA